MEPHWQSGLFSRSPSGGRQRDTQGSTEGKETIRCYGDYLTPGRNTPWSGTAERRRRSSAVCLMCADPIGSAVLTGLFLLFDLIYQVQGAWYVYLLIYAGLAALFTVLNLKRYRACRAAQKGGKGSGCED